MTDNPPDDDNDIGDDAITRDHPSMRSTRTVGRNIGALMASQSFTWILATVVTAITPRFLGAESLGSLRVALSVWAIAAVIAAWGTANTLTVQVARDRSLARSLSQHVIRLRLAVLVVICPALAAFFALAGYDRTTVIIAAIVGVASAIGLVSSTYAATMFGLQEMGQTARTDVLTKTASTGLTVVVLLLGGKAIALSVLGVAMAIFSLVILFRAFHRVVPAFQTRSSLHGLALLTASFAFLLNDASLVVYQQIDTVVMSLLVDRDAIGWYAAADTIFGSLLVVAVIATTSLFPELARLHREDPAQGHVLAKRSLRSIILVTVPIGLGTVVVSKSFVALLFGPAYANSAPVLAIFGVVTILASMTILLGCVALATGKVKSWTLVMALAITVSIPIDILLVPWADDRYQNGAIAGALGYIATETVMLVVGLTLITRGMVDRAFVARAIRCAIAGALMVAVAWPLRERFFLIPGSVALVVYAAAILLMRTLNDDERAQARRLIDAARRGMARKGSPA